MSSATETGSQPTTLEEAKATIAQLSATIVVLRQDVTLLQQRVHMLLRHRFSPSSERFHDPNQLSLFGDLPVQSAPAAPAVEAPKEKPARKPTGRSALPAGLKRVQDVLPVDEDAKRCDCCDPAQERQVIGYEVTETLEYTPAQLYVKETLRPKVACPSGQGSVVTPLVEPRILPKARAGVSLLVFVLLSKYQDHLPLYRIHKILKRQGVEIAESTLCDWVGGVTDALAVLVLLMKKHLLQFRYLQADETPAEALDPTIKKKNRQVYFWVYGRPWAEVVFDYRTTRGSTCPLEFLDGWNEGKLQVDDYRGYDPVFSSRPGLVRVGCMVHARRKFVEAQHHRPAQCEEVLRLLRWVFRIETLMRQKHRTHVERLAVRRRAFASVFRRIRAILDEGLGDPAVIPKSPYEKAVRYASSYWTALMQFMDDGELEMDNNSTENAIRPFAVGRKNWLHIGHVDAGDRAAVMYSLLTTCGRLGINPQDYLMDVLARIPSHPKNDLWALTPRGWLEAKQPVPAAAHPQPLPTTP